MRIARSSFPSLTPAPAVLAKPSFLPAQNPGYWAYHTAMVSSLVYEDEPAVRVRLADSEVSRLRWFDRGPTQAVGYLHKDQACLVFRGTKGTIDIGVDLACFLYGSPGRHFGFHRAWKRVEEEMLEWLASLPPHSGVVTAGHSLGGALAILCASELPAQHEISAVYTYGAPGVGSLEFALDYGRRLGRKTRQFKFGADAVTLIPPMPLFIPVCHSLRLRLPPAVAGSVSHTSVVALSAATRMFNYTGIPEEYFNRDPIAAVILGALIFTVLATNARGYLLNHLPIWLNEFTHRRFGTAALLALSIVIVQQLTHLFPFRIAPILRWGGASAVVLSVVSLHLPLMWLFPTLLWVFLIAVVLLRLLLPSASDHSMAGYFQALNDSVLKGLFPPQRPST